MTLLTLFVIIAALLPQERVRTWLTGECPHARRTDEEHVVARIECDGVERCFFAFQTVCRDCGTICLSYLNRSRFIAKADPGTISTAPDEEEQIAPIIVRNGIEYRNGKPLPSPTERRRFEGVGQW